ncbi:MAG: HIT family protein [Spirochaetaceae bacterium]|nr:HIT family protein [Spirochaetaceae bacterium]|tara:strand:+ start:42835 stop:43233 length:399 start_codon:yes stop_codon:yes gene_type:complete
MATIFSKIIAGEIPAYKVAEDEKHLAFLDVRPVKKGHVLAVPKKEIDYLFDMPQQDYLDLQDFARKVGVGLKKAVPCKRVGTAVVGLEVPHVHIHLIPMDRIEDISFSMPRLQFTAEEFQQLADSISREVQL